MTLIAEGDLLPGTERWLLRVQATQSCQRSFRQNRLPERQQITETVGRKVAGMAIQTRRKAPRLRAQRQSWIHVAGKDHASRHGLWSGAHAGEVLPPPHHLHECETELEVKNRLHENDDLYTKSAHEQIDYAARFRSGYWIFVGLGLKNTRLHDRRPNGDWNPNASRILDK